MSTALTTPDPAAITIVNIDDNAPGRYVKSRILRQMGYRVIEGGTGHEALELVTRERPTLVLLDVNLPDIDGIEVCRRIKADLADDSVLVLQVSAFRITSDDRTQALSMGADAYLVEPHAPEELMAQVGALLRRHAAEQIHRSAARRRTMERDRAEASNSAKSAFLSAMSHELRTPLNSIIGFAALIEAMGDNRSTEYAALIRESGEHLLGLVNDLLDLSKIEAGQMELHEESVDVQALVASAVRMMQPQAQRSDIALDWTVESGLAPLRGDERRLRQVLLNLIGNAVKYTQSGGRIRVAAGREADGRLALAVADTGIGIDPAEQGRVMEAFVQVDNTVNRGVQGTGLGLPLARRLTELHGGTLTLDSAPGLGTTVTIHLPPSRIAGLS